MNCGMRPQTEGIITNALTDVYANVQQIGCGGMGHVFKVIDEHGFTKALKINKVGTSTEELRDEFNIMQGLLHPRIAVVYGWVTFRKVHGFERKSLGNLPADFEVNVVHSSNASGSLGWMHDLEMTYVP